MFSCLRTEAAALFFAALLLVACAGTTAAQDDELGDDAADPIKLFDRGQEAHARREFEQALELYEEAIRLKPEFPEAEYQRAAALASLGRLPEAEAAYRRASSLNQKWALPHAALGSLLLRAPGREAEAEALLRRAVEIEPKHVSALAALAELRARAGDAAEAVALWRRATALREQDAALWLARARAERATKDPNAAAQSYGRALALDPDGKEARLGRAAALVEAGQAEGALPDLRALEEHARADARLGLDLANVYGLAGRAEDARRVFESLPESARDSEEGRRLGGALTARCEETQEAIAALERLVERDPKNAAALACLGSLARTSDPQVSLEYYRRASALEPSRAEYAVGFAAALVQLRRFEEAVGILRRVVAAEPNNYAAHANLAAALYGQKLYKEAVLEYKWVSRARPDLAVVHFFIGSAHDYLGEYAEALASYEAFLARADPRTNQLEIDKVNLRLPTLRNQIKRGEGVRQQRKAKR
ncbi:MAG TPA: tetratricopeptide repeat protein [Pyrinomonadaceae bacterium]|nr:tetratricopeptide repeat protein [Pyrinomonadaceae bacterium]